MYARPANGNYGRPVRRPAGSAAEIATAGAPPLRASQHVAMPPAHKRPVLMTVAEVAEYLRVSESWVRSHASGASKPKLPCLKLGSAVRFRQDTLDSFLETLEQGQKVAT